MRYTQPLPEGGGGSGQTYNIIKSVEYNETKFYEIEENGMIRKIAKSKYETYYRDATFTEKFYAYIQYNKDMDTYIPIITEILALLYALDIISNGA